MKEGKRVENKLIGEYLVAENKITNDQLQKALEIQANSIHGGKMPLLGTVLVEMGALPERELTETLQHQERDRREMNPAMYPPSVTQSR